MKQTTESHKTFRTTNVVIISIAHLVHDVYSSFLSPILPLLVEKLNMTYSTAGLLVVFQRLPSLLNPVVGVIAERMSLRYLVILAPAITTVSMSLLGAAPHYWVLALLLLIMGIGSTLFHVPAPVMIRQSAGEHTGRGMSIFMLGGELARTLGPITILAAVSWWGLEGSYKLIPPGLLCSGLLYFKFKDIPFQKPTHSQHLTLQSLWGTLVLYSHTFSLVSGIIFFRSILRNALTVFLPVYMHARGSSLWTAGIALSVLQFAGAGGTLLAGTISDKIGRRATLVIASILMPILMWAFIHTSGMMQMGVLVLTGLALFAHGPVMLAIFQDLGSDYPVFVNSIYMTINFGINSITTLLIGIMADHWGLDKTFGLTVLLSAGCIPLSWMLRLKK